MSRKACENIEYGQFVAYGRECRVYDDNKINYVKTKSVLEDCLSSRTDFVLTYLILL